MVAAQEGHISVVELLVSVGAKVNNQNNVSSYPIDMYVPVSIKSRIVVCCFFIVCN